jgi:ATPase, P-type (transporting), HAD superfamily, subfamily IC
MIDPNLGLNYIEVDKRKKEKKVNFDNNVKTKSIFAIFRTNLFTLFNIINFLLALMLVLVKSYENTVFIFVAFLNLIIGIINEIRAKLIIDKLSILISNTAKVIRSGKQVEIKIKEIVLDDIILFESGNQVVVDSVIVEGEVEVNQSFITGEEKPIYKKAGDNILSGSFILSGACTCQVVNVGEENYTSKISKDAKYIKENTSEILISFQKIIRIITYIIIPLGLFTFFKQYSLDHNTIEEAVIATVAALDGMIPNGLVLLTSSVLAIGVIRLQKYRVLVKELYSIETLARVDTVCIDKTGTLTEGKMEIYDIIPYQTNEIENINEILANLCAYSKDNNATSMALKNKLKGPHTWNKIKAIPFSSKRKYSGCSFENKGTYLIGAPEYLIKTQYSSVFEELEKYTNNYRVLILVHSKLNLEIDEVPENVDVIGFILLQDKIRKAAKGTLAYFKKENVDVKIISGDSIKTISNIANRLELEDIQSIDMTYIDENTIPEIIENYNVFGRVTPEQKKIIIWELQKNNHTVAMVGDGVNDVLALKESDCSVAMASGSDAARNVSQLVLLDSNFDALPKIILEGRKSINNIEKTGALFLSKTIYTIAIVILFLFLQYAYPFTPLQLTIVSTLTIGIPSLYLGLQPNKDLVKKNFLKNVLKSASPSALAMIISILLTVILSSIFSISNELLSSICVLLAGTIGFILLYKVSKPFNNIKLILLIILSTIFIIGVWVFPNLFSVIDLSAKALVFYFPMIIIASTIYKISEYIINK